MQLKSTNNKTINSLGLAAVRCGFTIAFFVCAQIAAAQAITGGAPELSAAEKTLAASSKSAIVAAGISPAYFERHFKLARVVDAPGDRRVVWNYKINEYETVINDAVGFYTDEKGRRVNIHSVRSTLSKARDILKTVSRKRADQLMSVCIGKFTPGAVLFQSYGVDSRAALLFTASSVPENEKTKLSVGKRSEAKEQRERRERLEREKRQKKGASTKTDVIETEDDEAENKPIVIGYLNLETGVCRKGYAQVDHPSPIEN